MSSKSDKVLVLEHRAIGSYIVTLLELPSPVLRTGRFMVQVVTFKSNGKPVATQTVIEPSKDYGYVTFNRACKELENEV